MICESTPLPLQMEIFGAHSMFPHCLGIDISRTFLVLRIANTTTLTCNFVFDGSESDCKIYYISRPLLDRTCGSRIDCAVVPSQSIPLSIVVSNDTIKRHARECNITVSIRPTIYMLTLNTRV